MQRPRRAAPGVRGFWPSSRASRALSSTGSSVSRAVAISVVVALAEQLVQRAVLEVRGEQAGKLLGRQVDHLQQQRLARRRDAAARGTASGRPAPAAGRRATASPAGSAAPRGRASRRSGRAASSPAAKLLVSARSRSMRGCKTCVPRPRVRSMRCSRVSSSRARRTVIRLQP